MFNGAVENLDPLTGALPETTHTENEPHEWRRVNGDDSGTHMRREHNTRAHPGADIEHTLIRADIELLDHLTVYRRPPHPWGEAQVSDDRPPTAVVVMSVTVRLVVMLEHAWMVSTPTGNRQSARLQERRRPSSLRR
jgi:hypothetical protein